MTEIIFLHPIIHDILHKLTNFIPKSSSDLYEAQRQAKHIIQDMIIKALLRYYQLPKRIFLSLGNDAEVRLAKYLKKLHDTRGETVTDEDIKQEIETINNLIDQATKQLLAQETQNA